MAIGGSPAVGGISRQHYRDVGMPQDAKPPADLSLRARRSNLPPVLSPRWGLLRRVAPRNDNEEGCSILCAGTGERRYGWAGSRDWTSWAGASVWGANS